MSEKHIHELIWETKLPEMAIRALWLAATRPCCSAHPDNPNTTKWKISELLLSAKDWQKRVVTPQ